MYLTLPKAKTPPNTHTHTLHPDHHHHHHHLFLSLSWNDDVLVKQHQRTPNLHFRIPRTIQKATQFGKSRVCLICFCDC
ncbi:hypothetical protein L6452_40742 [Arctium lappa]|uniref:Uncharacterized protein n=1 Tax=Arctium lappa TaxID=4217 RepID=A0ACB8XMR7_ARCLA|nr:hypothetical protein L6452_40742 [Arctium lappa]